MKGLTILSEILLAVTVIAITVILAMVASGAIGGQIQSIFQQQERGFVQEIDTYIEQTRTASGEIAVTYSPSVSDYSIRVQNQTVEIEVKNDITTYRPLISVEDTEGRISDADNLCFNKTEQTLRIQEGGCDKQIDEDLCENGCGPNVCRPDLGEDCTNLGCNYPEDAEDSGETINICKPEYNPGYINEGEPTGEVGWVRSDYQGVQEEGDRCEYGWECGSGLNCGSGAQSRCCPNGEEWNGTACEQPYEYRLAFVPLNSRFSSFDSAVDSQAEVFIQNYPLKSCSDKVKIEKISEVCDVSVSTGSNSCSSSQKFQIVEKVQECVDNSGIKYDKAVGLFGEVTCGPGWSYGPGTFDSVISTAGFDLVTAHEIGHEYGLNDEYLDTCRYGDEIGGPDDSILINSGSNCLQKTYDGDRGRESLSAPLNSPNSKYCAGGSASPFDDFGDKKAYSPWCKGNKLSGGGRDIMSAAGLGVERGFAPPSQNYLETVGDLSCS
jgi:hypothetical protein